VTQGEKIQRLKESIKSQQIRKMLSQSQAAIVHHQMQSQILAAKDLPVKVKMSLIQQQNEQY
jgi:hypothetical protein